MDAYEVRNWVGRLVKTPQGVGQLVKYGLFLSVVDVGRHEYLEYRCAPSELEPVYEPPQPPFFNQWLKQWVQVISPPFAQHYVIGRILQPEDCEDGFAENELPVMVYWFDPEYQEKRTVVLPFRPDELTVLPAHAQESLNKAHNIDASK